MHRLLILTAALALITSAAHAQLPAGMPDPTRQQASPFTAPQAASPLAPTPTHAPSPLAKPSLSSMSMAPA